MKLIEHLDKKQKSQLCELLREKSMYEIGEHFGLDKKLKNPTSVRNTVRKCWEEVLENPSEFSTSPEDIEKTKEILGTRKIKSNKVVSHDENLKQSLEQVDFEDISKGLVKTRDDVLKIFRKKLGQVYNDPKEMSKLNIATLATSLAILFDKAQLAQGQATQNIAVHAKITSDMTAEERLAAIMDIREKVAEKSNG